MIRKMTVVFVALFLGGCWWLSPLKSIEQATMKGRAYWYEAANALSTTGVAGLEEETALIAFRREKAWTGAAVPHCVMDGGPDVDSNVYVLEREQLPSTAGDFDVKGWHAVSAPYYKQSERGIETWIAVAAGNLLAVADEERNFLYPGIGMPQLQYGHPEFPVRRARVIGQVRSGDVIKWRRKPGIMRLEVFTPAGDHGFAVPIKVEAGHTYDAIYHYGPKEVWFELHDRVNVE